MELYNNADEFKVTESQTDESETIEFGINIDEVKVENIEDVLNEDSNGTIHTNHDKVYVEVIMSHDFKSWGDIKHHINNKLK